VMTSGMAHVSGSVMAAYVAIANVSITHLLTAVIMTAPANHHALQDVRSGDRRADYSRHRFAWKWKRPGVKHY